MQNLTKVNRIIGIVSSDNQSAGNSIMDRNLLFAVLGTVIFHGLLLILDYLPFVKSISVETRSALFLRLEKQNPRATEPHEQTAAIQAAPQNTESVKQNLSRQTRVLGQKVIEAEKAKKMLSPDSVFIVPSFNEIRQWTGQTAREEFKNRAEIDISKPRKGSYTERYLGANKQLPRNSSSDTVYATSDGVIRKARINAQDVCSISYLKPMAFNGLFFATPEMSSFLCGPPAERNVFLGKSGEINNSDRQEWVYKTP